MDLLRISDSETEEDFENFFEQVQTKSLDQLAPQVIDQVPDVKVDGETVDKYDAVYAEIPSKNAVFGRVLLEMIEEKGIPVNISSTSFFTAAKKNYLYHVLTQKNIECPKTVSIASEKAARGIERHIKGPVTARRFEELEEVESKKLDTVESIQGFTEGVEYGEEFILFQEYSSGDKYYCLVLGDKVISLKDNTEDWKFSKDKLKYSNISNDKKEIVQGAANALGADIIEVKLRGQEVVDMNPQPDLQMYERKAGQDVHQNVSQVLKGEQK
ncbi:ATP-grasp domain-containing protein [Candidatus Nanohalobium constans]|uniref:Ribosomal protein S6--L-glutamate ligase n=1 Tax=Candidatus Nanohalobium constans TaxID=2565781 RepID=A0A5Q0UH29_9ARCH|nr:hypothetical protein [Candidatus Nanohalobium constans]QGA80671.1 ribosomal protein S6--L-glutamate ligase [Candidatus Nanohalobium constans]